jgi:hypothetical protein
VKDFPPDRRSASLPDRQVAKKTASVLGWADLPLQPNKEKIMSRLCPLALGPACVLGLVGLLFAAPADKADAGGKSFTSTKGGFSVTFPAGATEPKEQEQSAGAVKLVRVSSTLADKTALQIAAITYPAEALKAQTDEARLDAMRDRLGTSFRTKVEDEKKIKLDGHPGRTFTLTLTNGGLGRIKLFMVKDRMYQIMVLGPKKGATSKAADQFLDSFKLAGK